MVDYEQLFYDFYMWLNDLQLTYAPDERHQGDERILREIRVQMLQELMDEMLYMRDKCMGGAIYGKAKMET